MGHRRVNRSDDLEGGCIYCVIPGKCKKKKNSLCVWKCIKLCIKNYNNFNFIDPTLEVPSIWFCWELNPLLSACEAGYPLHFGTSNPDGFYTNVRETLTRFYYLLTEEWMCLVLLVDVFLGVNPTQTVQHSMVSLCDSTSHDATHISKIRAWHCSAETTSRRISCKNIFISSDHTFLCSLWPSGKTGHQRVAGLNPIVVSL